MTTNTNSRMSQSYTHRGKQNCHTVQYILTSDSDLYTPPPPPPPHDKLTMHCTLMFCQQSFLFNLLELASNWTEVSRRLSVWRQER